VPERRRTLIIFEPQNGPQKKIPLYARKPVIPSCYLYIWDTQNLSVTYFFMDFWFASLKTETPYLVVGKLVKKPTYSMLYNGRKQ
jgi:hypothetical protein